MPGGTKRKHRPRTQHAFEDETRVLRRPSIVSFLPDREVDFVTLPTAQIDMFTHAYHHHATVRSCKMAMLSAVCGNGFHLDIRPAVDDATHPHFVEHMRSKLRRFFKEALDAFHIQGFCVYSIVPKSERVLYSYPRVHFLARGESFVVRKKHNPDRHVSVVRNDTDTRSESRDDNVSITYCTTTDACCPTSGDVRSIMSAVYPQLAYVESLQHSAMIADRLRSQPMILTKSRTDNTFDERDLVSIDRTSNIRSMVAMENMTLRNQLSAYAHNEQNQLNAGSENASSNDAHAAIENFARVTADPLERLKVAPVMLPLPMDADVCHPPPPTARNDIVAISNHIDAQIRNAFGIYDQDRRDRSTMHTLSDMHGPNVLPSRVDELQEALREILRTVWRAGLQSEISTGHELYDVHFGPFKTLLVASGNDIASKD